jgi:putative hydrolase of the HAD superfamily
MDGHGIILPYNNSMKFTTIFFDLDETLYPASSGLWMEIRKRINTYLGVRMGFPPDQIEALRDKYFRDYGTTLRGLQANYKVDMEEYLAFVHDIPLEKYIHPDEELQKVIKALPTRKFIFTNADAAHANRVINVLGLQGMFDGILDVHTIAPYCKPMPESFDMALKTAGSPDPVTCALLDDQARVTKAANSKGIFSILVGKQSTLDDADAAIINWGDLPGLLDGRI